MFHTWCLGKKTANDLTVPTFTLVRLDPVGTTGRLDSHCPAVDCHCSSASQVCNSGKQHNTKTTEHCCYYWYNQHCSSHQQNVYTSFSISSCKASYINQSLIFSYMKMNTKIILEHTQSQGYFCCIPRTPSKILKVKGLL